jgi:hypothetical protein
MTWRRIEKEEFSSRRERFMEITNAGRSKSQFEDF